jgi:hypothetical protein
LLGWLARAFLEPGPVARRWPAGQPRAQQWLGLGWLPRPQIGEDQRVLEDLALRVASANSGQVGERRFEQPHGLAAFAAGEGSGAGAQRGRNIARREAAVLGEAMQPADPPLQEFVIAGRCFGKGRMQIGEGETGVREMPARVCGDLAPLLSRDGAAP